MTKSWTHIFIKSFSCIINDNLLFQLLDYYLVMSKRVLSRLCLYWLPRYLLDLRMKDLSKDRIFSNEKFVSEMEKISDHDLHQQIFKITSMNSIPTSSISDLCITKMLSLDGSSFDEIRAGIHGRVNTDCPVLVRAS